MTNIRRVGLVTPGWPGHNTANGIATSVYFLAMGLREIGVTPVILARKVDGPCPEDIPVVPIGDRRWSLKNRLRARLWDPVGVTQQHVASTIATAIEEASEIHGLDVVLIEETHGWAGMVQSHISIPVFIVLHGPWVLHKSLQSDQSVKEDMRREARESRAFQATAGLIAPSHNVLKAVEEAVPLSDKPKIVLPNTLSVGPPTHLSAHQEPADILFVGRFDRHKGGDVMLEAFKRLAETHPQARLTFAGPDRGVRQTDGTVVHLASLLPRLPDSIKSRLTYKGPVDRMEVARLRAEHAIAVIASRYEVCGYTVLEAMGAGQAIVSTNVGGPAEVLVEEKTALLVPPDDPGAMAAKLGQLLDDVSLRQRLGEGARAKLMRDFDPVKTAQATLTFLQKAL